MSETNYTNQTNTTNSSISFNYSDPISAPTITSLSKRSSNPAIKSVLEINGQGFGTVASDVKVFLSNASGKVYPLKIIEITDIKIKVGLPGGLAGAFKV